jgi:hypothetical protein
LSAYKGGECEEYDKAAQAAGHVLARLAREPGLKVVQTLLWRFLSSLPSAPVRILASSSDPRYHPLVLDLCPREFGSYLSRSHGAAVAARSRERIAALFSVYEVARSRIDLLDIEFGLYIGRIANKDEIDLENLPFPPEQLMRRFCAPALYHWEAKDILLGLPNSASEFAPGDLLNAQSVPQELRKLASQIKSRALNRFYFAFLNTFALRVLDHEPRANVWSLLDSGEAFSDAISNALFFVEYPDRVGESMPNLLGLITSFEPESA